MHRTALLFGLICYILVAVGCYFGATRAVDSFQEATSTKLEKAVFLSGEEWVNVRANGLRVQLTGLAPDEAARFRVLQTIGKFVEPGRIHDNITILKANNILPPKFSLEVLRTEERISLIGLVPINYGRGEILKSVESISSQLNVTDMLEEAQHPVPSNWKESMQFGLYALEKLNRSKISITPEKIIISAVTESQEEKSDFERALKKAAPEGTELVLNISAPRPVISPFTLRFRLENGAAELASCSADTVGTRDKILAAAHAAGLQRNANCSVGLGVPTTEWAEAIILSINAVKTMGGGILTFTDSDISLVAPETISEETFDIVIGKLGTDLPELFSLDAVLPPKPLIDGQTGDVIVPDFTATKGPEGFVQLRGRLPNINARDASQAFAKSLFGNSKVYIATRVDDNLPDGWALRVLGGLEALAELHHGTLVVTPQSISLNGISDKTEAEGNMARILAVKVDSKERFELGITFDERLATKALPPTPESCEANIATILETQKIEFDPGKVRIDDASNRVIDEVATVLRDCPRVSFEIQGHTDNSGSEELNQNLSQSRADAVLSALLTRRILTSRMVAKGYGPVDPIADNSTEEGREINRRIEFKLLSEATAASAEESEKLADQGPQQTNADDIKRSDKDE